MPETLADLMRQVGLRPAREALETPRKATRPVPDALRARSDLAANVSPRMRALAERETQRSQAQGVPRNQIAEAGAIAAEFTGIPAAHRAGHARQRGDYGTMALELGNTALALGGLAGVGGARTMPRGRPPGLGAVRPPDPDAVTRLPVNPAREIGPNGMPIRPPEPFRNSLRGGSGDLAEAAGMGGMRRFVNEEGFASYDFAGPRGMQYRTVIQPDGQVDFYRMGDYGREPWLPRGDLNTGEAHAVLRSVIGAIRSDMAATGRTRYVFRPTTPEQTRLYRVLAEREGGQMEELADGRFQLTAPHRGPSHRSIFPLRHASEESIQRAHEGPAAPGMRRGEDVRPIRTPDLPMDEASRMARAREMGFDTETPLYHGTRSDVQGALRPSELGAYGPGVYVSPDPSASSRYAEMGGGNGGNVMPLFARGRLASPDDFDRATQQAVAEGIGRRAAAYERATEILKQQGFVGVDAGETQNIFSPSNIRSRFAAFDPANEGSANLLGGLAALAPLPVFAAAQRKQQRQ